MYKAITVKSFGATEHRPARIKATAGNKSLTVPYEYEGMDLERAKLAFKLAKQMGWSGRYIAGCLPDGQTTVFVRKDKFCSVDYSHSYGFGIAHRSK